VILSSLWLYLLLRLPKTIKYWNIFCSWEPRKILTSIPLSILRVKRVNRGNRSYELKDGNVILRSLYRFSYTLVGCIFFKKYWYFILYFRYFRIVGVERSCRRPFPEPPGPIFSRTPKWGVLLGVCAFQWVVPGSWTHMQLVTCTCTTPAADAAC